MWGGIHGPRYGDGSVPLSTGTEAKQAAEGLSIGLITTFKLDTMGSASSRVRLIADQMMMMRTAWAEWGNGWDGLTNLTELTSDVSEHFHKGFHYQPKR